MAYLYFHPCHNLHCSHTLSLHESGVYSTKQKLWNALHVALCVCHKRTDPSRQHQLLRWCGTTENYARKVASYLFKHSKLTKGLGDVKLYYPSEQGGWYQRIEQKAYYINSSTRLGNFLRLHRIHSTFSFRVISCNVFLIIRCLW